MKMNAGNKIWSIFLVIFLMLFLIGTASAAHTQTTTITPTVALGDVNVTFTINIAVAADGNSVRTVLITIPTNGDGFSNLECGEAPTDWSIQTQNSTQCVYDTSTPSARIDAEENKDFTVTATTASTADTYIWNTTTTDITTATDDDTDTTTVDITAPTLGGYAWNSTWYTSADFNVWHLWVDFATSGIGSAVYYIDGEGGFAPN